jgi:hypothetical protein
METQAIYTAISQFVVAVLAAGSGLTAIAYGFFRFFGAKWLESKFAERLQNLRAEQDQTIRYVQSTIDREIHRAKKLYDSEFTALSECWALLREAYDQSAHTIASFTAQVERMTSEELERHLASRGMDEWQRKEMAACAGKERQDAYHRWSEWERFKEVEQLRRKFRSHLDSRSIFFADGFTERFRVLEDLIGSSNIEYQHRVIDYGTGSKLAGNFDATIKLRREGEPLMKELEEMVRKRLWSVAKDGEPIRAPQ